MADASPPDGSPSPRDGGPSLPDRPADDAGGQAPPTAAGAGGGSPRADAAPARSTSPEDALTAAAWGGSSSAGLRVAPLTTLVAGLGCAGVAAARAGERGAVSALLATALVALFFWSGLLPILLSRGQEDRAAMGLAVLLVNYTLRLALALLLLRGAERADLVDARVLGVTIIVATLTWTGTQVALLGRGRTPV